MVKYIDIIRYYLTTKFLSILDLKNLVDTDTDKIESKLDRNLELKELLKIDKSYNMVYEEDIVISETREVNIGKGKLYSSLIISSKDKNDTYDEIEIDTSDKEIIKSIIEALQKHLQGDL